MNAAIDYLIGADPLLAPWIRSLPACNLAARNDLFSCLSEAIISQMISTAAAKTLIARVQKAVGGALSPQHLALMSVPELRACGLSGSKAHCLLEAAQCVSSGAINLASLADRPENEILATLTAIRGIGPWTAEIVMIFGMGKQDVLPVKDLGVRHGLAKLYSLGRIPQAGECAQLTNKWRPYRSVGTWYLWRIKDSASHQAV